MNNLQTIPTMNEIAINSIRQLEAASLQYPQEDIETDHVLHGGMYARTILVKKGVVLTGALIKKATILVVSGRIAVTIGDETIDIEGYNIIAASAYRKQAFYAKEDTYLTMIFPTSVSSVSAAEDEFTDEAEALISRKSGAKNTVTIMGEL